MDRILEPGEHRHGLLGGAVHQDALALLAGLDLFLIDVIYEDHGHAQAYEQERGQQEIDQQGCDDSLVEDGPQGEREAHEQDLQDGDPVDAHEVA